MIPYRDRTSSLPTFNLSTAWLSCEDGLTHKVSAYVCLWLSLGKGEVDSSILSGSTIQSTRNPLNELPQLVRALHRTRLYLEAQLLPEVFSSARSPSRPGG